MKAKVIKEPYRMANLKIGDVVEIVPGMETDAEGVWNVPAGKLILCKKEDGTFTYASLLDMEMVDGSPTVDWDEFRREAAKDILSAVLGGGIANGATGFDPVKEELVLSSIRMADELIRQLKGEEK